MVSSVVSEEIFDLTLAEGSCRLFLRTLEGRTLLFLCLRSREDALMKVLVFLGWLEQ